MVYIVLTVSIGLLDPVQALWQIWGLKSHKFSLVSS